VFWVLQNVAFNIWLYRAGYTAAHFTQINKFSEIWKIPANIEVFRNFCKYFICWGRYTFCLKISSYGTACLENHIAATINNIIMIICLHHYYYIILFRLPIAWFIKNVADFRWTKLALSRNWIKCVKCVACRIYRSVTNSFSSKDIVFWKFVELCEMCCCVACSM